MGLWLSTLPVAGESWRGILRNLVRRHWFNWLFGFSASETVWKASRNVASQPDALYIEETSAQSSDVEIQNGFKVARFPWESMHGKRCPVVLSVRFDEAEQTGNFFGHKANISAKRIGKFFKNGYEQSGGNVYYPNCFKKSRCLAHWHGHWCKGLCKKSGTPTNHDCWAFSFRWHLAGLHLADRRAGQSPVMVQVLENIGDIGPGQQEEIAIADDLGVQIYLCFPGLGGTHGGFIFCPADRYNATEASLFSKAFTLLLKQYITHIDDPTGYAVPILKYIEYDINRPDIHGKTLAHVVAKCGHAKWFPALRKLGANMSCTDAHSRNLVHVAAQYGQTSCLRTLKQLGVDFHITDEQGMTPAHRAVVWNRPASLHVLKEVGADLGRPDDKGYTPAHAAAGYGRVQCLRVLHELGIYLDSKDMVKGFTPAHIAAAMGKEESLRTLNFLGADMTIKSFSGRTPAHLAAQGKEDPEGIMLRTLKECGVDVSCPDEEGLTPVHFASIYDNPEKLRMLKDLGATIEMKDAKGMTPAHKAAELGQGQALRTLVELKADLSSTGKEGRTAAHYAASQGQDKILSILLEMRADLTARVDKGYTPATIAAGRGHGQTLRALQKLGVDITCPDGLNNTPADYAIMLRKEAVWKTLCELGAARQISTASPQEPSC